MPFRNILLMKFRMFTDLQGVKINDKHIETIVKQMLQKLVVVNSGDTVFIDEDLVNRIKFIEENEKIKISSIVVDPGQSKLEKDQLISRSKLREINADLERKGKGIIESRDADPATFGNVLLGITQAALTTESFISAASFQETTKVLTNAATEARVDHLIGLKENVVMGQLIPAGTGIKRYKNIILTSEDKKVEVEEVPKTEVEEEKSV